MNGTSLAIQSVHDRDSGWYTCKHVLGRTQRCFEIYLRVQVENVTLATVPGLTTSETILETKMEGSSGRAFVAVLVASVIVGIAIMAALMGLLIYRRRNTRRVTQQTQRHTPGTLTHVYEIVDLTPSEDLTNNCLYQLSQDEGLCTFRSQ
ncbi:uncharacterized protein PEZ65_006769 [Lycodopsis pacificus]